MTSCFVIRRQKDGNTKVVSSSKTVTIPMTNSKTSNLPSYMLTLISKMGTSVITLTFGPPSQVNKKSTQSRHSDTTTPSASCPSSVKVTKIDTCSKPSTLLEILPDAISFTPPKPPQVYVY